MTPRRALLASLALAGAVAEYCGGKPDPKATPNAYPINTVAPVFTHQVPNGKAYTAGQPGFEFTIMHLWGTPFEMGFAQGQLFTKEVQWVASAIWQYLENQVEGDLSGLPQWLADLIAELGLEAALDLLNDIEDRDTPEHHKQELQGIANATGLDYKMLRRIHLLGELTQGDCSMMGALGAATAGAQPYSFRALDWDTDIPANEYPAVTVYHPAAGFGHAWANVGFLGWIGAMTGYSSAKLSIHEIGVSFPDSTFGNESFAGIPFTYLLRDILQFDNAYTDTVERIATANRTCDLILGVGDGTANGGAGAFRAFEYSSSVALAMDWTNQMPLNDTWHPRIKDTVYYGMDWLCPNYSGKLAELINTHYGAIEPVLIAQQMLPLLQSGDLHVAITDLAGEKMLVSFMPTNSSSVPHPVNAYDRQYTQLDMAALWAVTPPAL